MKSNSIKKAVIVVVASHSAWAQRQGMVDTFCKVLDVLTKRKDADVAVILVNGDEAKVLAEHAQGDPEAVARQIAAVHPRGHSYHGEAKALALGLLPEDAVSAELFVISNGQSVDDTSKVDQEIMHRVQSGTLKVIPLLYGMQYEEKSPRPLVHKKEWVDLQGQYIAMDGTNVCGWSTRKGHPKLNQLLAICRYCRMGGVDYTAWFDPSFKYCLEQSDPESARMFRSLLNTRPDRFKEVPAGLLNGQPIKADTFVLNDAAAHNGWFLANDLYRKEANDNPSRYGWVKDASDKRLVGQVSGNYIFIEPIGWKIKIDEKIK